ncbi:MAG: nitrile hydratase [Acidimicrobiales bacterium]|jgi:nitrile hydratase subunit alpha
MSHDHEHHGHEHHQPEPTDPAIRTEAIEQILVEQGLVTPERIDELIHHYETEVGPMNGAQVVATAWIDSEFKSRLLADGSAAMAELGFDGAQGERMVVVENTDDVHNLVVCTLCSCYPWPVLGLPPSWYKSPEYRARAVREPRAVLAEFGTEVADEVDVRVWDSSAEIRYLVLPQRPAHAVGDTVDELAPFVGRDAMIGVRLAGFES